MQINTNWILHRNTQKQTQRDNIELLNNIWLNNWRKIAMAKKKGENKKFKDFNQKNQPNYFASNIFFLPSYFVW